MFLYAESPKQERNTLSHLTESIGLVILQTAQPHSAARNNLEWWRGYRETATKKTCGGTKRGSSCGQVCEAGSRVITLFFICFRGGWAVGPYCSAGRGCGGWKEKRARSEERGTRTKEEWLGGQRHRERDYYSGSAAPSVGTVKLLIHTEYGRIWFKGYICAGITSDWTHIWGASRALPLLRPCWG